MGEAMSGLPVAAEARCCALGCDTEIPTGREWCGHHWRLIPKRLQTLLYHTKGIERSRVLAEARAAVETAQFGARLL